MRHVPDGVLRRLIDEPLVVADRDVCHVEGCTRCQARSEKIAEDAAAVHRLFEAPRRVHTSQSRLQLRAVHLTTQPHPRPLRAGRRRAWRLIGNPLSTGVTVAAVGVALAGVTAAATLTTVFAPTQVTPVPVSESDVQQFSRLMGLDSTASLVGFAQPSGSETFSFGTLSWSSSGGPQQYTSLADAEAATGLSVSLPTSLPNGIGVVARYAAMAKVTVTVSFGSNAGSALSNSSLVATIGPAIDVAYSGATGGTSIDPLEIITVAQPIVTSTGATLSQIENFLLSRSGVPADLAQEIRLLGNLQNTLLIPTPPGVSSESVEINGSPGQLLTDNSNAASGAIWEDKASLVHIVAGLLDREDLLSVAQQIR